MNSFHHYIQPGTKVLFASFPADGHFSPLTGLAVHLKKQGCDVRWYTSRTYEEKLERLDIPFYGFEKAVDISAYPDFESAFPERKKYKSQISKLKFDLVHAFILRSTEYYEDIRRIYQEFSFQVMVADISFGAIPFVKEKMNIPVISIGVVPLVESSKDLAPTGLGIAPSKTFAGRIKQNLLRFLADKLIFSQPTRVMRQILSAHGIDSGKANIFDILIQKSTVVLQSGTPGFEYKRSDLSSHIHFAGPLLPFSQKRDRKKWYHEKLEKYGKRILVTQGTIEKEVEKLLVPALEAFKNSDHLVIVTTGGARTEELRKAYPQENIIIENFIPFNDVMPYVQAYVSNGGYGGVLMSIQNRVPMVVAGVHEGKNEINARVGYFRIGINLRTEFPSSNQIRDAVETVIGNNEYSENIRSLSREFSQYKPGEIITKQLAQILRQNQVKEQRLKEEEAFIY